MTELQGKIDAIMLSEGLHRDGDEFYADLERDYASDVVFFNKPRSGADWYSAFTVNAKGKDARDVKAALKYMVNVGGDWEGMLDLAAMGFAERADLSRFQAVVTPQAGGHHAILANLLLASLEEHLPPTTEVLRGGMVKNLETVSIDWDKVVELAPKGNTPEQDRSFMASVESNFNSAMRAARNTGSFRIRAIRPQFRKFIKGLVEVPRHGNVLIVDDVRTTGTTHRLAQDYLSGELEGGGGIPVHPDLVMWR